MNKIIIRLSLLIAGFLVGASNVSAQVKTIADYPDSTIARYASLDSRGFEVIPSSCISYTNGHTGGMLYLKVGNEICKVYQYPGNLKNSSRIVYGLYDKKNNSAIEYALDLVDFMKKRDSLNVEKPISDFLSEISSAKEFKKFFKIMTKKFGYKSSANVTTDDLARYVTLNNGKRVPAEFLSNYELGEFFQYSRVSSEDEARSIINQEFIECFKRDNTYYTDVKTEVVEQYVVLDDGKLNFPGCDEKVVKSYLSKYGLSYKSFDTYLSIRAYENFYLNTFYIKGCGFIKLPENIYRGGNLFIRGFSYKENSRRECGDVRCYDRTEGNVRTLTVEASIDGDIYKKTYQRGLYVGEKYVEGSDQSENMPYADINFRRFLARHFPTREEILSWIEYDNFVSVSREGNDVVAYNKKNSYNGRDFCSGPHFQKRWDGRWTCSVPAGSYIAGSYNDSIPVVLDSSTTLAMLPFIRVEKAYLGVSDSDKRLYSIDMFDYLEESPNINVVLDDSELDVKFEPAFQAGLWVDSTTTPKYSWNGKLHLDNVASSSKVLYDKSHSYKLALGLDKSDPKHPQIVRNGIDSQKAENLKIAFENNEAAQERRRQAEDKASYIREKSKIYGMNQVKTFVNNGYLPFIGMSWSLFKNEYYDNWIFIRIERSDSNGNYIVKDSFRDHFNGTRWYYFYNNRLDHWVDRP